MNNCMFKQRCFTASLIFGFVSFFSTYVVAMDCKIANELSVNIYMRAFNANIKGNINAVAAYKEDFWDIYKYGSDCEDVKKTAEEFHQKVEDKLIRKPISTPISSKGISAKDLQNLCTTPSCTITVTGGGIGSHHAYESPKVYEFSQSGPEGNLLEWRKITQKDQKLEKIAEQDLKDNKLPD